MAGSKSNYLEAELLDHVLGGATVGNVWNPPANIFVAAFTAAPSDTGGGTEVTGGSYARKSMANTTATWSAAVAGAPSTKTNAVDIPFVPATASWGTVVAAGIFDASSGGNLLYWGDLTASKTIDSGDQLIFAQGQIQITED